MVLEKIVMLGDSIIDWNHRSKYINYGHAGFKTSSGTMFSIAPWPW